ncbi:MFS transporter [Agromyces sp. G08B096]|uniref:MFS transporter n=1 Tax=Agromyces sp. G08B096 TaxID=3156399 RepID=A0AAU7W4U1_9MICO
MTTIHPGSARPAAVLTVLFSGAFVMGCAEMLVVGLIDLIASDLHVSVPEAGALVTANALGLAVGGPLLTLLTTRIDRRRVLLAAIVVFVAGNLVAVLGAGYAAFLVARVAIGAVQGLFIAAAMVTALTVSPPERAGRAMAIVITGFASASALGLPLGTLLGQAVGWRGSFAAVVGAALVVLVAAVAVLPSVPTPRDSGAAGQARFAFAPRVLAILGLAALVFVAVQSAITYLVPFLAEVTGVTGPPVGLFLAAYGIATTAGSFVGGRFADADASRALVVATAGLTCSLLAMVLLGGSPVAVAIAVVGIGFFGMATGPSLQHRVVALAGAGAPLASSLPASAVNAGIAGGAFAGGVAIDAAGLPAAALTGVVVAAASIGAAWATGLLKPAVAVPEPAATS